MIVEVKHWKVNYQENTIENTQTKDFHNVEPRTMEVLKLLIENHGEVVTREQFFSQIWKGRNTVEESLTTCISELRSIFEDKTKTPRYIKTIYKKGYKFLAEVKPLSAKPKRFSHLRLTLTLFLLIGIFVVSFIFNQNTGEKSAFDIAKYSTVFEDYNAIRDTLLKIDSNSILVYWRTKNTGSTYAIRYTALESNVNDARETKLSISDKYDFVIWEHTHHVKNASDKTAFIEYLIDVLKQLQKYKESPEMVMLTSDLRLKYQQALYLIDKRGEDNLNKAIALLDILIEQQPEFTMAIINKAVAARMLGFYQPTLEMRKQASYKYELTLRQAAATAPSHPVVISLTNKLNLEKRNWNEYEQSLLNAIEYSPACVACVRNLAEYYLDIGHYEFAERLVVEHLDYFPLSIMMHSFLGQIYNMQADIVGAKQQVEILNALGNAGGSDTLAMELNIALNEGDLERYQILSEAMVEKHPAYASVKAATDAQIAGNVDRFKRIVNEMPRPDFNQSVAAGDLEAVIDRVYTNISKGNLRDLRLTHGWRTLDSHLAKSYGINILKLKQRPEISNLFENVGLKKVWRIKQQWPDYCYIETYQNNKPEYCFQ